MKRWWLYGIVLIAAMLLRAGLFRGTDVGALLPVEVVLVEREHGMFKISTDADAEGRGVTVHAAISDLKETAQGEIFLETVDYIMVREKMDEILPELTQYLRPACGICVLRGDAALKDLAGYLRVHPPKQTLRDYCDGEKRTPVLQVEEGRMSFG